MDVLAIGLGALPVDGVRSKISENHDDVSFCIKMDECLEGDLEKADLEQDAPLIKKDYELEDIIFKQIDEEEIKAAELAIMALLMDYLAKPIEEVEYILEDQGISFEEFVTSDNLDQMLIDLQDDKMGLLEDETKLELIKDILQQAKTLERLYTVDKAQEELIETQGVVNTVDEMEVIGQAEEIVGQVLENHKVDEGRDQEVGKGGLESHNKLEAAELLGASKDIEIKSDHILKDSENVKGARDIQPQEVTKQLVRKIEYMQLKGLTQLNMELQPKSLGRVSIELVEKNGVMFAQIEVESEDVKDIVGERIDELRQMMEEQGLTVQGMEVSVSEHSEKKHMEQQKQKASKRIQEIINKHLEEQEQDSLDNIVHMEMDVKV